MLKKLYSVFDNVALVYSNPFTSINDGTAFRDFSHACQDPQSSLHKSPNEFSLYHLGDFDDSTGEVISLHPRRIVGADEILSKLITE